MATTYQPSYSNQPIVTHADLAQTGYRASQYLVGLGRVFFSLLFILSGLSHFSDGTIAYAASVGVPMASLLVPLSGAVVLFGGLSVGVGYHARWGAVLLALFLIPVTLVMHNFWVYSDPVLRQMQYINFLKNLSLFGATFLIMHFGAGPVSVDNYINRHSVEE